MNVAVDDVDNSNVHIVMKNTRQSIVLVFDETCGEREFNKDIQLKGAHTEEPVKGRLSYNDIDLLLAMFDIGISPIIIAYWP